MNRSSTVTDPRFQLEPSAAGVQAWILILGFAWPVAITIAAWVLNARFGGSADLHRSVSPSFASVVGVVAAVCALVCAYLSLAVRHSGIALNADAIAVTAAMRTKRLPLSALSLDEARVIDLDERNDLRPFLKTGGISFPGFRGGSFRLRNRRKAWVATLGGPKALWIPTRDGYDLLVQPRQPQALLDRLRDMARGR